jgi:hypothetical protein
MNGNGMHDDKPFERDLDALSRAYHEAGSEARDAPPAHIDSAILAAAHRAVHARPQPLRRSWAFRWATPLAAAAVLVLAVSLNILFVHEQPDVAPAPLQKALAPRAAPEPVAPAQPAVSAAPPATKAPARRLADTRDAPAKPAQTAEEFRADAFAAGVEKKQRVGAARDTGAAAAPHVDAVSAVQTPLPEAFPEPAGNKMKRAEILASTPLTNQSMEIPASAPALQAPAVATKPAAPVGAGFAQMASGLLQSQKKMEESKPAAQDELRERAKQDQLSAATAPLRKENSQLSGLLSLRNMDKAPQEWIKEILELRKQGKIREADEELRKFRKRHPDFALPDELKGVLPPAQ